MAADLVEKIEEGRGRCLAGFDSGLVVGVDVHQRSVESDGSFEEGDEIAQGGWGDLIN